MWSTLDSSTQKKLKEVQKLFSLDKIKKGAKWQRRLLNSTLCECLGLINPTNKEDEDWVESLINFDR